MGPLVVGFDKTCADGIFPDVIPSGLMVLFRTDAVVEVVALPGDAEFGGGEAFPIGQHAVHAVILFPGK